MSYTPSVQSDFVNQPQYLEESTFGTTPGTPTYVAPGYVTDLTVNKGITIEEVAQIGEFDIQDTVKVAEDGEFTITYNIFNSTLPKYGINLPSGAGTIDTPLSFIWSKNINGVEYYQTATGCRAISTSMKVERGLWEVTQTFKCQQISIPSSTEPDAGATYAPVPTTAPWSHDDMGASAFVWNSVTYDTRSLTIDVTYDLGLLEVNGQLLIQNSIPAKRTISFSADVYQRNDVLATDHDAHNKRTATVAVDTGVADFTLTNAWIESHDPTASASSTDLIIESISGRAESVALT